MSLAYGARLGTKSRLLRSHEHYHWLGILEQWGLSDLLEVQQGPGGNQTHNPRIMSERPEPLHQAPPTIKDIH